MGRGIDSVISRGLVQMYLGIPQVEEWREGNVLVVADSLSLSIVCVRARQDVERLINAPECFLGQLPLHMAAEQGHPGVVQVSLLPSKHT